MTPSSFRPFGNAMATTTTSMRGFIPTPVAMRAAPSIDGIDSYKGGAASISSASISGVAAEANGVTFVDTVSGATANQNYAVAVQVAAALVLSSEL